MIEEERLRLAAMAHKGTIEMGAYQKSVMDDVKRNIKNLPSKDSEDRPLALNQILCDIAYRIKPESQVKMAVLILSDSGILNEGKAELEIAKLRGFIS